ncbi:MAG: cytochrome c [Hyphomicrobiales bacterium]|nr:cytochrome c [Hyphomicrobiales bacterium]
MKQTCKFCWGLSALLIVAVVSMAYVFVIPGKLAKSDDGRTTIVLSAVERDLVLSEMRGFLEGIETITTGIAENDMKVIAESAAKMGMASAGQVPVALMTKLPSEFRSLGMATHKAFDALALEAQDMGDAKVILTALGELMNNCTTCHAGYRLDIENNKGN